MTAPKKLPLLVATSTYPRWAADSEPSFVHHLCRRLQSNFDVHVVTSRSPGALTDESLEGVNVHRFGYAPKKLETLVYGGGLLANLRASPTKFLLLPSYLICMALEIRRIGRLVQPKVLHAHWFVPSGLVAALASHGVPLVITAHGSDVLRLKAPFWVRLRRRVAGRAKLVTVVGESVAAALSAEGTCEVAVMPMGVDLKGTFTPDARSRRSGDTVLFVGSLVRQKRVDVLLEAFHKLQSSSRLARLRLAGDGPERRALENIATRLGVLDQVDFLGRLTHSVLVEELRRASVVVVPSGEGASAEGLGLVAVEALGCGAPVVLAPNLSLRALLPKSAPVVYAKSSSADDIASAIALTFDRDGLENRSDEWRTELIDTFDWENVATRYEEVLRRVALSQ